MAAIATTYTVRPNDTLVGIARALGVGWVDLAQANKDKIGNYNLSMVSDGRFNVIHVGDVLTVPGGSAPQTVAWDQVTPDNRGTGANLPPNVSPIVILGVLAAALYFFSR